METPEDTFAAECDEQIVAKDGWRKHQRKRDRGIQNLFSAKIPVGQNVGNSQPDAERQKSGHRGNPETEPQRKPVDLHESFNYTGRQKKKREKKVLAFSSRWRFVQGEENELTAVLDLQLILHGEHSGNTVGSNVREVPVALIRNHARQRQVTILHDDVDGRHRRQRVAL